MPVVMGRGALACVAALTIAGAGVGCGGALTGNPGTGGTGGVPTGSSDSGRAGTLGSAGASGTTGAAGTAGGSLGDPPCPSTVTRGAACLPTDIQLCYKTCGPEKTGVKSETCSTGGVYLEMSGCTFDPDKDFSCYSIPGVAILACPAGPLQASTACDVPTCMPCNSNQGLPGGQYVDSSGAPKIGWCVCQAPNAAGLRTWSCASDTQWPCPAGAGCSTITTGFGGNGGGGTGGTAGTGGGGFGQPACPSTVTKGGACAPTDAQLCYKTCGPEAIGVKSETCAGGVYAEMSGCSFDAARDYSCYRIPAIANNVCAAGTTPQANAACTINACSVCNSTGGLPGGGYLDSAGAAKIGYCVCSTGASGASKWSCASDTAWPCPVGPGC